MDALLRWYPMLVRAGDILESLVAEPESLRCFSFEVSAAHALAENEPNTERNGKIK